MTYHICVLDVYIVTTIYSVLLYTTYIVLILICTSNFFFLL